MPNKGERSQQTSAVATNFCCDGGQINVINSVLPLYIVLITAGAWLTPYTLYSSSFLPPWLFKRSLPNGVERNTGQMPYSE